MLTVDVHASNHGSVDLALSVARAADRAGAGTVWISEDLYFHGSIPLVAAAACHTSSVRLGFSVLTPYGTHPGRLAMDLTTLTRLAPERIVFGIGAGVRHRVEQMGATWTTPVERVRVFAETVQALLAGETVTSSHPAAPAADLALAVQQPPGRLPVYAAAVGPKALRQAGALFDGILLSLMATGPHIRAARALADEGAAAAGRTTAADLVATIPVRVHYDAAVAIGRSKELVGYCMTRWGSNPSLRSLFTTGGLLGETEFDEIVDRLHRGESVGRAVPDDIAQAHCPAGTPSHVADLIRTMQADGLTGVSLELGDELDSEPEIESTLRSLIPLITTGEPTTTAVPSSVEPSWSLT